MSHQAIVRMLSAAQQSEALRQKLEGALSPDSLVKVAAENGFAFTADELVAAIQAQIEAQNTRDNSLDALTEELSDEEAEMVAGGAVLKTARRYASVNSYYHNTGVVFESGECFVGRNQIQRSFYTWLVATFERATFNANFGEYELRDEDGDYNGASVRMSQLGLGNWQIALNLTEQ